MQDPRGLPTQEERTRNARLPSPMLNHGSFSLRSTRSKKPFPFQNVDHEASSARGQRPSRAHLCRPATVTRARPLVGRFANDRSFLLLEEKRKSASRSVQRFATTISDSRSFSPTLAFLPRTSFLRRPETPRIPPPPLNSN